MYLSGGFETHRTDIKADFGGPGKFCLMPKDSETRWQLGAPQEFTHLYFNDDYLKRLALRVFDIDPRLIQLPELTFSQNTGLEALVRHHIMQFNWTTDHLAMERVTDTILVSLLRSVVTTKSVKPVKGGLAPRVLAKTRDYIRANYRRQIYLLELADLASLSEYHFCRMFNTPQDYLTSVRIEQVKTLIDETENSLSDIALLCGFSNQSHMGRFFKKLQGISPSNYRRQSI